MERLTSFKISTVQAFRTVERTLVTSAPEHGHQKLMVYNTHQPASDKRRFPQTSRINCAHAIIAESIRDNSDMEGIVAFLCIGDPNLSRSIWQTALVEVQILTLHFAKALFVFATQEIAKDPIKMKPGDIALALTNDSCDIRQTDCFVENREAQHDCLIVEWSSSVSIHDGTPSHVKHMKGASEHERPWDTSNCTRVNSGIEAISGKGCEEEKKDEKEDAEKCRAAEDAKRRKREQAEEQSRGREESEEKQKSTQEEEEADHGKEDDEDGEVAERRKTTE